MSSGKPWRDLKAFADRMPSGRTIAVTVVISGLASAAIIASGLALVGWNPGPVDQYKLTNALDSLVERGPLIIGAVVLLLLVPLDRRAYFFSVPIVASPFLATIAYECIQNSSSHNLLPFEIASWLVLSAVVHIPSFLASWIYSLASTNTIPRK